ncbi:MAG: hypothetical protein ACOY3X_00965 [Pseudomonadota bacterium]
MSDVVMAKRNVGSLTDPSGHYQKLFFPSLDVAKAWENHKKWREAKEVVSDLIKTLSDREKQAAIHGSRFIENRLVRKYRAAINAGSAKKVHAELMKAIDKKFKEGYLAVLFKNAKKCEALSAELDSAGI